MAKPGRIADSDKYDKLTHFRPGVFSCKCGQCAGHSTVHVNVALALDEIAEKMDVPPLIVTGSRCPMHNRQMGKDPNSPHCAANGEKTFAVDVRCETSEQAFEFLKEAIQVCTTIIAGPGKIFHIEIDPKGFSPPRFWRKADIE